MTQLGLKLEQIYEEDYILWLERTAKYLRNRNIEQLDWEHLVEEIEALGNEQRRKVESYLRQILKHLLLYQYWRLEDCLHHWEIELDNFRTELKSLVRSKTLYNYLHTIVDETYNDALRQAKKKSRLDCFPAICPYTVEQILDTDFLPD
jgi:hypothetical protein